MRNFLALLTIILVFVIVNCQEQTTDQKPVYGQTFDEIVVSSDLNVRRKSKENRQSKRLLSNVPASTLNQNEKPSPIASRLISGYDSRVVQETRKKRGVLAAGNKYLDVRVAEALLKSWKR